VDLNYEEDRLVTVDFNLVATEDGEFVEVQSSGEEATFAGSQLDEMLALGRKGIGALIGAHHGDAAGELIVAEVGTPRCRVRPAQRADPTFRPCKRFDAARAIG